MKNFWRELPRPFFALAPMADVTDAAFRRIVAKYSKVPGGVPYVTYTEFVSADGLVLAPEAGRSRLLKDLLFTEAERPVVAQFFTAAPAHMERAAALAAKMGFDGVDINMGCPAEVVVGQGAGAELIRNQALAQELIAAAKRGAPGLPVSVKTRLGYHQDELETWVPALLEARPVAIIIHARTRKELSQVPAHWERVARAVEIRDALGSETLIVGNGDVRDVGHGRELAAQTGADGVMIGRGAFGDPWLFSGARRAEDSVSEKLRVLVEHARLYEELLRETKGFAPMRKTLTSGYCRGFPGAKELRVALMEAGDAGAVERVVESFLKTR